MSPEVRKGLLQIRSLARLAGGVLEDSLAPGLFQRVALEVECLVGGGDPGVADQHHSVSGNSSFMRFTVQ